MVTASINNCYYDKAIELYDKYEIINNYIKGKEIISCIDNYNNISFEILNTLL